MSTSITKREINLKKFERMINSMKEKSSGRQRDAVPIENQILSRSEKIPQWSEKNRGIPNSFLRSGLFRGVRISNRKFIERVAVPSQKNEIIFYSGPELDQLDLDVWAECLNLSLHNQEEFKHIIYFSYYSFLHALGRCVGNSQYKWLTGVFTRLISGTVEIRTNDELTYIGSLILEGARDNLTNQAYIQLNPRLINLFKWNGWSKIEWLQRQTLHRQPLAQWLHGYYSSHARPHPIKVETVYRLCGSQAKNLNGFRFALRRALGKLEEATGWKCVINKRDLVIVKKTPSGSQRRHLARHSSNRTRHRANFDTA